MTDNSKLDMMRRAHEPIGLNAEDALRWHEMGHALAASVAGHLMKVVSDPLSHDIGGQMFFAIPKVFGDDLFFAVMGPAAQLAYMRIHRTEEPSSFFVDKYLHEPAQRDFELLAKRWPNESIDFERLLGLAYDLSDRIQHTEAIVRVLRSTTQELLTKRELSGDRVQAVVGDAKFVVQELAEYVKSLVDPKR